MQRAYVTTKEALEDLKDIWRLVYRNDGDERADRLTAKIESFCFRLADFPHIGTRHDERRQGLRSVAVPGVKRATVVFAVAPDTVTVLRIGYLGRNVLEDLPE